MPTRNTSEPAPGPPLLTAVASGKGGVGKTWFSVTLAQSLARMAHRVLLFDGDLGLANIDIQLGLNPMHDLGSVLSGKVSMPAAVQSCLSGGFDVLAGRSGSGALAGLGPDAVEQLIAGLAQMPYDHVLLDLSAGLDSTTQRLTAAADILLVIATDEPTSLTDAYAVIKLHEAAVPGGEVRLVINQAASDTAGHRTYATLARACAQFLGRTPALAGIVRRDERVRDAIRRQMPLLSRHPASIAGADVARIAGQLSLR